MIPIKTFLTLLLSSLPILIYAQKSKFAIALQTTTIERPIPFGRFQDYEKTQGYRGHYSAEILARFFLNKNLALRLRAGLTQYKVGRSFSFFGDFNLKGQLQKYAIGIESRRVLGENLTFRLGCDAQIGFFKKMTELNAGDFIVFTKQYDTNSLLSFNPLMGLDWSIWRGLSVSAELRLPFERIRYDDKGSYMDGINEKFYNGSYNYVGFSKPICSFQIGYHF